MKKIVKIICVILTVIMLTGSLSFMTSASYDWHELCIYAKDNPSLSYDITVYSANNGDMFAFLPKTASDDDLVIRAESPVEYVDGEGLVSFDPDEGIIVCSSAPGTVIYIDDYPLTVMKGCLPVMNVSVGSGHTLSEIHRSRNVKIPVAVGISGAEQEKYDLSPTVAEMKTRGYSTWEYDKKPYQIKFDKKQDLFGMGKAKKWILLANYIDGTAVRNKVVFDLGEEIGCKYVPSSVFVDLYVDDNYLGVYQLAEKVEAGSSRIDLKDDFGVVLELDHKGRLDQDDIFFMTPLTNKAVVFKDYVTDFEETEDPEIMDKAEEVKEYVRDYVNRFERLLYAKNTDWETISSMIDVDSFVRYFWITEFTEEVDATFASTFFYMDGKDDVLHCDPLWDYDRCFGLSTEYEHGDRASFFKNITVSTDEYRIEWFKKLFCYKEFNDLVKEFYDDVAKEVFESDRVNDKIDGYQDVIWDSLMMNYTRWRYVFLSISHTANEYVSGGPARLVDYVTEQMKVWIIYRSQFLETAYGRDVPTLRYSAASSTGVFGRTFSDGCLTDGGDYVGSLRVNVEDSRVDGGIEYTLYADNKEYTASDGEIAAPDGVRPTGISVKLTGNLQTYYTVQYRIMTMRRRVSAYTASGRVVGSKNGTFSTDGIKSVEIRLIRRRALEYSDVVLNVLGSSTVFTGVVGNAAVPEDPEIEGYKFEGWYLDPDFTERAETPVFGKTAELYAKMSDLSVVPGDANGDGDVDMKDVLLMRRYIAGLVEDVEIILDNADLTGDGDVDMRDVLALRRRIAGI